MQILKKMIKDVQNSKGSEGSRAHNSNRKIVNDT